MKRWSSFLFLSILLIALPSCNRDSIEIPTDQIKSSCVRFVTVKKSGEIAVGSGFVINDKGDVVTNNHVIAGAKKIFLLHSANDRIMLYSAEVLAADREADLAVVSSKLKGPALPINSVAPKDDAQVRSYGFPAIADDQESYAPLFNIIGSKLDDPDLKTGGVDITRHMQENKSVGQTVIPSGNNGIVSRTTNQHLLMVDDNGDETNDKGRSVTIVEHNINIGGGNSGGPFIDASGRVAGVVGQNRYKKDGGDNVKFAIAAVEELMPFLKNHSVPFRADAVDTNALGKPSTKQLVLFSLAGAAALVAVGLGVVLLFKQQRAPQNMPTVVFNERIKAFMNGGKQPTVQPPPLPSGVAWELDVTGPNGFHQQVGLTDSDFVKGRGRVIVGRNADFCGVPIKHDSVSRQQLHFELKNGSIFVADRNSSNGTKVNGGRLASPFKEQALKEGDRLEFGELSATIRRRF
ncbi:MAG: trypsin-like peptidase domain-containing protein [Verrucomicrobiaceae bacterium]